MDEHEIDDGHWALLIRRKFLCTQSKRFHFQLPHLLISNMTKFIKTYTLNCRSEKKKKKALPATT